MSICFSLTITCSIPGAYAQAAPRASLDSSDGAHEVPAVAGPIALSNRTELLEDHEKYPIPISSTAEKTGPNTITLLSYPKYYTDDEGAWTAVDTNFKPSRQAGWDYEVSTGIWTLLVNRDGTFSARHAGDAFNYRLSDYGFSTGAGFESLAGKAANWDAFSLLGDTARWSDVYPGIDLTVRYIHDILKVDVILSEEARARIENDPRNLQAKAERALKFRFRMDNTFIQAERVRDRLGVRNLSASFDVEGPLTFERNGKVRHKMRPAVAWVLGGDGKPDREAEPIPMTLRWDGSETVKQVEIGIAMDDLSQAPEGRIVLDPSMTLDDDIDDTVLDTGASNGSDLTLWWADDEHVLIAPKLDDLGTDKRITKAELSVYEWYSSLDTGTGSRAYWVTEYWTEGDATWTARTSSLNWGTPGGSYSTTYQSPEITLPDDDDEWITWDVTTAFRSFYPDDMSDFNDQGFLLKMTDSSSGKLKLYSSEYTTPSLRPKLVIDYRYSPEYGADQGHGFTTNGHSPSIRTGLMEEDHLELIRFFLGDGPGYLEDVASAAETRGMKVVVVAGAKRFPASYVSDATEQFATYVLGELEDSAAYIGPDETIVAVEIGNEEDEYSVSGDPPQHTYEYPRTAASWPFSASSAYETADGFYDSGEGFAEYYVAAWDAVKEEYPDIPIYGPSLLDPRTVTEPAALGKTYAGGQYSGAFLAGFIDGVIALTLAEDANADPLKKLPDMITYNGYPREEPPERIHRRVLDGQKGYIEWLEDLRNICLNREDASSVSYGYCPEFADVEYACDYFRDISFSPARSYPLWRQAVHYIRKVLMESTAISDDGARFLHKSIYYHHYWSDVPQHSMTHCFAYYDDPEPPDVLFRPIRKVARTLFASSPTIGDASPALGAPNTKIWLPIQTTDFTSGDYSNEARTMWCGWDTQDAAGKKWGAIWRYKNNLLMGTTTPTEYWYDATPSTQVFEVEEDLDDWYAYFYKFSDLDDYDETVFEATGDDPVQGVHNAGTGKTTFSIPNVDENPTFIRFYHPNQAP